MILTPGPGVKPSSQLGVTQPPHPETLPPTPPQVKFIQPIFNVHRMTSGARDRTVGRALTLHAADLDPIPGTLYDHLSMP